ncbi:hypothetical protein AgCh_011920 [Apium graveolens]
METQIEIKFLELKQDKMIVAEYEAKFTELSQFVLEFVNNEEKKSQRFKLGECCPDLREAPDLERPQVRALARAADPLGQHSTANPVPQYRSVKHTKRDTLECVTRQEPLSNAISVTKPNTSPTTLPNPKKRVSSVGKVTKSFISQNFAIKLNLNDVPLREVLQVELAKREIIPVNRVYPKCKLELEGKAFEVDLIPFVLGEFDMLLGIDWLSSNGAQIDCEQKKVRVRVQYGKGIVFKGQRQTQKFLTMIQAKRLLKKGNENYLAYMMDTNKEVPNIQDTPVVNQFEDVFPENLPGLPPNREIDFAIELAPGMTPVSKAPYSVTPIEMKELASQL